MFTRDAYRGYVGSVVILLFYALGLLFMGMNVSYFADQLDFGGYHAIMQITNIITDGRALRNLFEII